MGRCGASRWLALVPALLVAAIVQQTSTSEPLDGWRDLASPGFAPPTQHVAAMRTTSANPARSASPVVSTEPEPTQPAGPSTSEPTASTFGQEVFSGPADDNRVALTFDDGPSTSLTPSVLRTLERHQVHATFFVLGHRAQNNAELLQAIDAQGHEIGNHGWSHTSLRSLFPGQIKAEIDNTNAVVREATGKRPALFRPAFGRYAESAVDIIAARDMNLVLWNADGRDWDGDADAIVTRVLEQARPGAIILLHDREAATARALPRILNGLQRKGLRPVPVSELTGLPATTAH